jgi:hypothetical protein
MTTVAVFTDRFRVPAERPCHLEAQAVGAAFSAGVTLPIRITAPALEALQPEAREALSEHLGPAHGTVRVRVPVRVRVRRDPGAAVSRASAAPTGGFHGPPVAGWSCTPHPGAGPSRGSRGDWRCACNERPMRQAPMPCCMPGSPGASHFGDEHLHLRICNMSIYAQGGLQRKQRRWEGDRPSSLPWMPKRKRNFGTI